MTLPEDYYWNEPDKGCVSCGQGVLTIVDHRCGMCLGDQVRFCPLCLGDIGAVVDRDFVRRVREASWDVSREWNERKYVELISRALEVRAARRKAGFEP
jgi:hypothetical protein